MISESLIEVAEILLIRILNDKRVEEVDGYVEMFDNCREQGYRIIIYKCDEIGFKTVAFSENRNSDDIVVYSSNRYESGLSYSEDFWKSAKFFKCKDYEGAKEYIIKLLKEEL